MVGLSSKWLNDMKKTTTSSSALHSLKYDGALTPWNNFDQEVAANYNNQEWRKTTIKLQEQNASFQDEHLEVGDETGVQSRFSQHFGEKLTRIFEAQGMDINFPDFKCLGTKYEDAPDSVIKTSLQELRVAGETKVPWI